MSFIKQGKLTLKQRLFCIEYIECKGKGTEAVIKAGYEVNKKGFIDRNLAKSIASENLTKPDILEYINELLRGKGLNDQSVAIQHLYLIQQFADLGVKVRAIDLYYRLTGKYKAKKIEHSVNQRLNEALDHISSLLPKST